MKRKLIYTGLLLSLFAFAIGCNGKTEKEKETTPTPGVTVTAAPTFTPMPTADVTITKGNGDNSTITNKTSGYSINCDTKKMEMENGNNTLKFKASKTDKKANEEANLYISITATDKKTIDDLGNKLKSAYGKSMKKKSVTIGKKDTKATQYTLTNVKKLQHEIYIIAGKDKGWYIELKCPAKYKKKYDKVLKNILESLTFEEKKK